MIVIALILAVFAVGFFCWLLFNLAVYALPLFVGFSLGLIAFHHDAGVLGGLLAGLLAGSATLIVGQIAFAFIRVIWLRAVLALAFALPAAVAGYSASFGLLHIGIASLLWCNTFAAIGAVLVGATAFARLALLTAPGQTDGSLGHALPAAGQP